MDVRIGNNEIKRKLEIRGMLAALNTCIPAIVDEFDASTQRVSATPAIKYKHISPDGDITYINYPKITNIPLAIQRGNGVMITYPIKQGDVCTLIFSQRSIDNFLLEGNIQKPYEGDNPLTSTVRLMDMTDALCFPGVITNQEFINNYSTSAVELRNSSGDVKVSLSPTVLTLTQGEANIEMSGGNINMSATSITISGLITLNGKDWDTHKHSDTQPGNGTTGVVA